MRTLRKIVTTENGTANLANIMKLEEKLELPKKQLEENIPIRKKLIHLHQYFPHQIQNLL